MAENEIVTREKPQMQLFTQMMEDVLAKLERYCASARPMLDGEVFLSGEEVCELLKLSTRTLQEYRSNGTLAYYKDRRQDIVQAERYSSDARKALYPHSNKEIV